MVLIRYIDEKLSFTAISAASKSLRSFLAKIACISYLESTVIKEFIFNFFCDPSRSVVVH